MCSKDCVFEKMARPYERWRYTVHLINQIVGSGFSLIPSNDYKYSTHDNQIARRRLSADRKNNDTVNDVGVNEPAFPKFALVCVASHASSSTTSERCLPDP